jgi:hypothetical protein
MLSNAIMLTHPKRNPSFLIYLSIGKKTPARKFLVEEMRKGGKRFKGGGAENRHS